MKTTLNARRSSSTRFETSYAEARTEIDDAEARYQDGYQEYPHRKAGRRRQAGRRKAGARRREEADRRLAGTHFTLAKDLPGRGTGKYDDKALPPPGLTDYETAGDAFAQLDASQAALLWRATLEPVIAGCDSTRECRADRASLLGQLAALDIAQGQLVWRQQNLLDTDAALGAAKRAEAQLVDGNRRSIAEGRDQNGKEAPGTGL